MNKKKLTTIIYIGNISTSDNFLDHLMVTKIYSRTIVKASVLPSVLLSVIQTMLPCILCQIVNEVFLKTERIRINLKNLLLLMKYYNQRRKR